MEFEEKNRLGGNGKIVKKGTGCKKEQAEIGNRTEVGNNKDIIRFKVRVRKVR